MAHTQRRHEVVDHTADARIRVRASTLPGLFEEATAALSTLTVEIAGAAADPEWVEVEVEGHDLEHLAFAWLNELIALAEVRRQAIASAHVVELCEIGHGATHPAWRLCGRVGFRAFDPVRVRSLRHAKAATLHGLEVRQSPDDWSLVAVVDV